MPGGRKAPFPPPSARRRHGHSLPIQAALPIIFLTTSRDHALCAYEVDAVQYLVKPLDQDRFYHAMDSAMSRMRKEQESQIVIKVAGGVRQLSPSDILYCESQKNYQILYLAGAECRVRMTTENLWKLLADFLSLADAAVPIY